jgi:hypothetical protein
MGGGNAQKSKTKRDRNNEKKAKDAKQKNHAANKSKMAADREGFKCKICMTTFMITASVSVFYLYYTVVRSFSHWDTVFLVSHSLLLWDDGKTFTGFCFGRSF